MTTRIGDRTTPNVSSLETATRTTAKPSTPFRAMMQAGSQAVMASAEGAVLRLPGGPVLAAAFRAGPESQAGVRTESAALQGYEPRMQGAEANIENVMAQNQEQNLYYLQLQQQISSESRQYTAVSNVLKARHDTVKNAIGNIR